MVFAPFLSLRSAGKLVDLENDTLTYLRIDPRGLGTQLFGAASPNQVIKINA